MSVRYLPLQLSGQVGKQEFEIFLRQKLFFSFNISALGFCTNIALEVNKSNI